MADYNHLGVGAGGAKNLVRGNSVATLNHIYQHHNSIPVRNRILNTAKSLQQPSMDVPESQDSCIGIGPGSIGSVPAAVLLPTDATSGQQQSYSSSTATQYALATPVSSVMNAPCPPFSQQRAQQQFGWAVNNNNNPVQHLAAPAPQQRRQQHQQPTQSTPTHAHHQQHLYLQQHQHHHHHLSSSSVKIINVGLRHKKQITESCDSSFGTSLAAAPNTTLHGGWPHTRASATPSSPNRATYSSEGDSSSSSSPIRGSNSPVRQQQASSALARPPPTAVSTLEVGQTSPHDSRPSSPSPVRQQQASDITSSPQSKQHSQQLIQFGGQQSVSPNRRRILPVIGATNQQQQQQPQPQVQSQSLESSPVQQHRQSNADEQPATSVLHHSSSSKQHRKLPQIPTSSGQQQTAAVSAGGIMAGSQGMVMDTPSQQQEPHRSPLCRPTVPNKSFSSSSSTSSNGPPPTVSSRHKTATTTASSSSPSSRQQLVGRQPSQSQAQNLTAGAAASNEQLRIQSFPTSLPPNQSQKQNSPSAAERQFPNRQLFALSSAINSSSGSADTPSPRSPLARVPSIKQHSAVGGAGGRARRSGSSSSSANSPAAVAGGSKSPSYLQQQQQKFFNFDPQTTGKCSSLGLTTAGEAPASSACALNTSGGNNNSSFVCYNPGGALTNSGALLAAAAVSGGSSNQLVVSSASPTTTGNGGVDVSINSGSGSSIDLSGSGATGGQQSGSVAGRGRRLSTCGSGLRANFLMNKQHAISEFTPPRSLESSTSRGSTDWPQVAPGELGGTGTTVGPCPNKQQQAAATGAQAAAGVRPTTPTVHHQAAPSVNGAAVSLERPLLRGASSALSVNASVSAAVHGAPVQQQSSLEAAATCFNPQAQGAGGNSSGLGGLLASGLLGQSSSGVSSANRSSSAQNIRNSIKTFGYNIGIQTGVVSSGATITATSCTAKAPDQTQQANNSDQQQTTFIATARMPTPGSGLTSGGGGSASRQVGVAAGNGPQGCPLVSVGHHLYQRRPSGALAGLPPRAASATETTAGYSNYCGSGLGASDSQDCLLSTGCSGLMAVKQNPTARSMIAVQSPSSSASLAAATIGSGPLAGLPGQQQQTIMLGSASHGGGSVAAQKQQHISSGAGYGEPLSDSPVINSSASSSPAANVNASTNRSAGLRRLAPTPGIINALSVDVYHCSADEPLTTTTTTAAVAAHTNHHHQFQYSSSSQPPQQFQQYQQQQSNQRLYQLGRQCEGDGSRQQRASLALPHQRDRQLSNVSTNSMPAGSLLLAAAASGGGGPSSLSPSPSTARLGSNSSALTSCGFESSSIECQPGSGDNQQQQSALFHPTNSGQPFSMTTGSQTTAPITASISSTTAAAASASLALAAATVSTTKRKFGAWAERIATSASSGERFDPDSGRRAKSACQLEGGGAASATSSTAAALCSFGLPPDLAKVRLQQASSNQAVTTLLRGRRPIRGGSSSSSSSAGDVVANVGAVGGEIGRRRHSSGSSSSGSSESSASSFFGSSGSSRSGWSGDRATASALIGPDERVPTAADEPASGQQLRNRHNHNSQHRRRHHLGERGVHRKHRKQHQPNRTRRLMSAKQRRRSRASPNRSDLLAAARQNSDELSLSDRLRLAERSASKLFRKVELSPQSQQLSAIGRATGKQQQQQTSADSSVSPVISLSNGSHTNNNDNINIGSGGKALFKQTSEHDRAARASGGGESHEFADDEHGADDLSLFLRSVDKQRQQQQQLATNNAKVDNMATSTTTGTTTMISNNGGDRRGGRGRSHSSNTPTTASKNIELACSKSAAATSMGTAASAISGGPKRSKSPTQAKPTVGAAPSDNCREGVPGGIRRPSATARIVRRALTLRSLVKSFGRRSSFFESVPDSNIDQSAAAANSSYHQQQGQQLLSVLDSSGTIGADGGDSASYFRSAECLASRSSWTPSVHHFGAEGVRNSLRNSSDMQQQQLQQRKQQLQRQVSSVRRRAAQLFRRARISQPTAAASKSATSSELEPPIASLEQQSQASQLGLAGRSASAAARCQFKAAAQGGARITSSADGPSQDQQYHHSIGQRQALHPLVSSSASANGSHPRRLDRMKSVITAVSRRIEPLRVMKGKSRHQQQSPAELKPEENEQP